MNRVELVAAIAEQTELSKKDAEKALCCYRRIKEGRKDSAGRLWNL